MPTDEFDPERFAAANPAERSRLSTRLQHHLQARLRSSLESLFTAATKELSEHSLIKALSVSLM